MVLVHAVQAALGDDPPGVHEPLVGLLRRLNRERGLTVVFVSHDLTLAAEIADRLLLLVGGRAVQVGTPAEVLSEAVLEAAYGCPVVVDKSPVSGRPVVHVRWE